MHYKNSTNGNCGSTHCAANAAKETGDAGGPRGECSSQQQHSIAWQIVLMAKKAGPPDDAKVVAKKRHGRPARGGAAPSAEVELRPRQHISMRVRGTLLTTQTDALTFPPVLTQKPRASTWTFLSAPT